MKLNEAIDYLKNCGFLVEDKMSFELYLKRVKNYLLDKGISEELITNEIIDEIEKCYNQDISACRVFNYIKYNFKDFIEKQSKENKIKNIEYKRLQQKLKDFGPLKRYREKVYRFLSNYSLKYNVRMAKQIENMIVNGYNDKKECRTLVNEILDLFN